MFHFNTPWKGKLGENGLTWYENKTNNPKELDEINGWYNWKQFSFQKKTFNKNRENLLNLLTRTLIQSLRHKPQCKKKKLKMF